MNSLPSFHRFTYRIMETLCPSHLFSFVLPCGVITGNVPSPRSDVISATANTFNRTLMTYGSRQLQAITTVIAAALVHCGIDNVARHWAPSDSVDGGLRIIMYDLNTYVIVYHA